MFPFNFSDFPFPADMIVRSFLSSFVVVVPEVFQFLIVTIVEI